MVKMKFGIATRPSFGSKYNGDMYLIREFNHKILICVIDGLGHGELAALASDKCVKCIEEHYREDLVKIFEQCDVELRKTNGVVMGIVLIDIEKNSLSYAGVGNISARVISSKPIHLISRDGIVGYNLPKIKEYKYPYTSGEAILMYSDGISSKAAQYPLSEKDVQEIADEIMRLFGKDEDDAIILVAR